VIQQFTEVPIQSGTETRISRAVGYRYHTPVTC